MSRRDFLAALLDARGLEFDGTDKAIFMIRTGIITDEPSDLMPHVTRLEALRWSIQALGLAFEAEILSDVGAGFSDEASLPTFDKGCLFVGTRMEPSLIARDAKFSGGARMSDKDARALLERVRDASSGLSLDVTLSPYDGLTLRIHREGVFSGIPRWRVYIDDFADKQTAEAMRIRLLSEALRLGMADVELSVLHTQYELEWVLRSGIMDNYADVRRLVALTKGLRRGVRVLPVVSNPDTSKLPKSWFFVTADPGAWKMTPLIAPEGPQRLLPMSRLMKLTPSVRCGINAAFFAITSPGNGYPIGTLRVRGRTQGRPYRGRTCFGWNEDSEARFGFTELVGGEIVGTDGTPWDDMTSIIQAGPMLLDDGEILGHNEGLGRGFTGVRHPRSVVGITQDGKWAFLAVDGRNGLHASGATIAELSAIAAECGFHYALNLDGGGSTEIIVGSRIYNSPSEGKERPISYGIGLMPR